MTEHREISYGELCEACKNNDKETVRRCLEQGFDLKKECNSHISGCDLSPLALACCGGHEEIIKMLLEGGADPNQRCGMFNQSPMHMAAVENVITPAIVDASLCHGADVNIRDDFGHTVLQILSQTQFNDTCDNMVSIVLIVKLLLENGASVNARDEVDRTPLYEACVSGNIDLAKIFIAKGAIVNFDIGNMAILRLTVGGCNIEMFELLVNAGAHKHLTHNALINPCNENDYVMIARMLDTCDVNINMALCRRGGMTILHHACGDPYISSETVRLLLDRGADVRAVSDTGNTALHYAAEDCDCNKIYQLLFYNHQPDSKNNENQTPLVKITNFFTNYYAQPSQQPLEQEHDPYCVVKRSRAGVLALTMLAIAGAKVTPDVEHNLNLLRNEHPEAQIHVPDYGIRLEKMCCTLIRRAIPAPVDTTSLRKLIDIDTIIDILNFTERDPLGYEEDRQAYLLCRAIKKNDVEEVKLHINKGVDLKKIGYSMKYGDYACPLALACYTGQDKIIQELLKFGADPNRVFRLYQPTFKWPMVAKKRVMTTPITNTNINKRLLPVNVYHRNSMTILHYACNDPRITSETVRLLLDRGADVGAVSATRDTALHYAVTKNDCNKIRQLLTYNPPLNIKNSENQTPLVKIIQYLITIQSVPSPSPSMNSLYRLYVRQCNVSQFKMLVAAGAKATADVELELIQLRTRLSEAERPDFEISSEKSLKKMCRSVIRGTIRVPVDSNACMLPIPKYLQEYLNFPELD